MQTMLQAAETRTQVTNPNEQLQTTEQSLEIMQQLLFGIVSNLASARNFFKPDVYGLVDYHFECEETGGNGFSTEGKTTFTGLKRGVSKRVNYLLNFLVGQVSTHRLRVKLANAQAGQWSPKCSSRWRSGIP